MTCNGSIKDAPRRAKDLRAEARNARRDVRDDVVKILCLDDILDKGFVAAAELVDSL